MNLYYNYYNTPAVDSLFGLKYAGTVFFPRFKFYPRERERVRARERGWERGSSVVPSVYIRVCIPRAGYALLAAFSHVLMVVLC